jgi:hypothetical protein
MRHLHNAPRITSDRNRHSTSPVTEPESRTHTARSGTVMRTPNGSYGVLLWPVDSVLRAIRTAAGVGDLRRSTTPVHITGQVPPRVLLPSSHATFTRPRPRREVLCAEFSGSRRQGVEARCRYNHPVRIAHGLVVVIGRESDVVRVVPGAGEASTACGALAPMSVTKAATARARPTALNIVFTSVRPRLLGRGSRTHE